MISEKENKASLWPVEEIGSAICDRLFAGETLSEICRDAPMPDKPTVMCWLAQYPKFLDECVFTYQLLAEDLAAEAVSRKRVRGAKIRRLRLVLRHWVADRLTRKIVPQSEPY